MRGFVIFVALAGGVAVAAPVPKDKGKPKPDTEAIQGTWLVEKFEGDEAPPPELGPIRVTFQGGKLTISLGDRQSIEQATYKLDPAAKVKTIDIINGSEVAPGIYELKADTLRLCVAEEPNLVRPTEFKVGKQVWIMTLRRVTDGKKEK